MNYPASTNILEELRPFFYPKSIAIVGVSQDTTKPGSTMLRALKNFGFRGQIYPVGQRITELYGLPVFPSISSIPGEVDFVRMYISAQHVLGVVKECRDKGVPAVEIFTGGFKETGTEEGKKLEAALVNMADKNLRIIGPNCFGVYSPKSGIPHLDYESYPKDSGALGLIAQSGGLSEDVCRVAQDYGFRFSKVVGYGNACDINETDLLRYLEADPATKFVAVYMEGPKKGREFFEILQRLSKNKPVIFWKGGLTPEGARAAASHTASIAGNESIWNAVYQQTLAIRVNSLEELVDTITAFYHLPSLTDNRVSVICSGGGTSVAATDTCSREGLVIPKFSNELRQKIAPLLPPIGTSTGNPVDVGTPFFPPAEILREMLEHIASSGVIGSIVIDKVVISTKLRQLLGYGGQISWEDKPWLEELPVQITKDRGVPVIVILREGGDKPGDLSCESEKRRLRSYYQENGVLVYPTIGRALKALGRVVAYYRRRQAVQ